MTCHKAWLMFLILSYLRLPATFDVATVRQQLALAPGRRIGASTSTCIGGLILRPDLSNATALNAVARIAQIAVAPARTWRLR